MIGTENTTATVGAAGAAFGAVVAWGVSLIHGVDVPVEIGGAIGTVSSYIFGRIFG